ncbi:MAG: ABC-F family ATP-binding cassette domain-containing protein [Phycisphaerae bacterium]|nr:ABC-F family ATP-binding cassette domain-containing protein [Phycisphaerae bacterium]
MLLSARAISKTHSLQSLFRGVSLTIDEGDRVGLIGPNGAGKSTLLKLLAGQDQPDEGVIVTSKGMRAVYVPQHDHFREDATAREAAAAAGLGGAGPSGVIHDHHEAEVLADMILERVGFDAAHADSRAGSLSGGWRKRLSVACALCSCGGEPDLLLLDEPTNHLDLEGIRWLEELVKYPVGGGAGVASVFVTHDRAFLESTATRVVELSSAYPQGTLSVDGNYTEFLRRKEEFLAGQARAEQAVANLVRKDLAWLARGAQARRTKAKSRAAAGYERMDVLAELKERNAAAASSAVRVGFNATGRKTRKLIEAKSIAKSMGGRLLFRGVDLELGVGDCLGLLGPNGSGKTTLIRVLTGELPPDEGRVVRSDPPPRVAVFSQHRREFEPSMRLRDALSPLGGVTYRGQEMHITAWSRRFLFRDEQLEQPVRSLSGGELARIHIARIMLEEADVLVLDEPTNDLDIPTLETLEEALEDFPGALILVTHDRAMLDRLATEILALDGSGFAGVYASVDQALASRSQAARPREQAGKAPAAVRTSPTETDQRKKKLTYAEQMELDGMEKRIMEAESKAAAAHAALDDPAVLADHARMTRACHALSEAQAAVDALYARWEELGSRA